MDVVSPPMTIKIIASVLVVVGLILSFKPELIGQKLPDTTFEAVELRVRWGLLMGVGLLLLIHFQLKPWLLTMVAAGLMINLGALIARVIGMALDGVTAKLWFWLAVEVVVLIVCGVWYAWLRKWL